MSRERKISDFTVISTGVIAWSLFAFGAIKLVVIYAAHPSVTALIAHNVASIIFLLYFIGYLKSRFTIFHLLILWLSYNAGVIACNWFYNYLFVLRPPALLISTIAVLAISNLVVLLICRGLVYLLRRKTT